MYVLLEFLLIRCYILKEHLANGDAVYTYMCVCVCVFVSRALKTNVTGKVRVS